MVSPGLWLCDITGLGLQQIFLGPIENGLMINHSTRIDIIHRLTGELSACFRQSGLFRLGLSILSGQHLTWGMGHRIF